MQTEFQCTRKKRSTIWSGSWSNGLPDSYTDVIINSAYDTGVNGSFNCNNLVLNANFTISTGTWVKVQGTKVSQLSSAILNVANKGQFILLHPDVDVSSVKLTANFTPNTLLMRLDYWFISSPISGIPILDISPNTLPERFYEYGYGLDNQGSPFDGFFHIDNSAKTVQCKGYHIRTPNNFPGTPTNWNIKVSNVSAGNLNSGVIFHTPSFINDITAGSFVLVGNPYLGNLDLAKFLSYNSEKINSLIHVWYKTNNSERESYVQINATESRSTVFSTELPPFQGFIVQYKNADVDKTLVFTPDMQIIGKNFDHNYFNLEYKQKSINIPVGSCTYNADTFEENFYNYSSSSSLMAIYVDGANKLIHSGQSPFSGQIIDLYYRTVSNEDFTINLRDIGGSFENFNLLLIDTKLNVSTNLRESSYTFAGATGESSANRFKIQVIHV